MIAVMDGEQKSALERLGRYIVSRRTELGYKTRVELAEVLNLTIRTLHDIEHGDRQASPGSYAMIEGKLGWAPGSCAAIIKGGEPRLINVKQRSELAHITTQELLLELQRRIIQDRGSAGGDWGGLDPFGDWPQDSQ